MPKSMQQKLSAAYYDKVNTTGIYLKFVDRNDRDILNYLYAHRPIQTTIKRLIREEIARERLASLPPAD